MNILDPVKNFADCLVSTGYNASATSVVLSSGEGAKLPDPATDGEFNLTWYDSDNYPNPSDDPNKEIVRCTARSADTLTVTRGQEGTTATTKNTAGGVYKMILTPTKKTIDDIDDTFTGWNKYTDVIPTRASADDPTYVLTFAGVDLTSKVSVGMKIKWTQNSTVRYGFVTAISFSTDTTVTLYGGTDYDVDDTATYAISDVYFSHHKAPLNFPLDPDKWSVEVVNESTNLQTSPTAGTWYNTGGVSIVCPIGVFLAYWTAEARVNSTNTTYFDQQITLSTASNTESDTSLSSVIRIKIPTSDDDGLLCNVSREGIISTTTKQTYYLNQKTDSSGVATIGIQGDKAPIIIRLTISYL